MVAGKWLVIIGSAVVASSAPSELRQRRPTPQVPQPPELIVLSLCAQPLVVAGTNRAIIGFANRARSARSQQHLQL